MEAVLAVLEQQASPVFPDRWPPTPLTEEMSQRVHPRPSLVIHEQLRDRVWWQGARGEAEENFFLGSRGAGGELVRRRFGDTAGVFLNALTVRLSSSRLPSSKRKGRGRGHRNSRAGESEFDSLTFLSSRR